MNTPKTRHPLANGIRTDRLTLRPFRPSDAAHVTALVGELDADSLFELGGRRVSSARLAASMIRESLDAAPNALCLAILPKGTRAPIGGARLSMDDSGNGEIGLWFSRAHRGLGYGRETLDALLDAAFSRLGCRRIRGVCLEKNVVSRKLMKRCGFAFEGAFVAEDQGGRRIRRFVFVRLSASVSEPHAQPVKPTEK